MVTVIQDDSLARGISGAGSAIANALGQHRQRQRGQQQLGALGEILQGLDPSQPMETQVGVLAAQLAEKGVSPALAQPLLNTLLNSGLQERQLRLKGSMTPNSQGESSVLGKALAGQQLSPEELSSLSPQSQRALLSRKTSQENIATRISQQKNVKQQQDEAASQLYESFALPVLREKFPEQEFPENLPPGLTASEISNVFKLANPEFAKTYEVEAAKGTAKFVDDLRSQAQGARQQDAQLKRIKKLTLEDKASTIPLQALSKVLEESFGIVPEILQNPTNEQIEKLSMDLVSGISKIFPGRILQSEFESYLRKLPRLLQTQEGRLAVVNNMLVLNEATQLRYDAYKELMKGRRVPPLDIQDRIESKISDRLEDIYIRFEEGLGAVPPATSGTVRRYKDGTAYDVPEELVEQFDIQLGMPK